MKIIAINGSPRKNGNTVTILKNVLNGAASSGAETEFVHLYDLNFKGCISCFSCKLKEGKSYGRCAVNDDLKPVLKKIEEADAIILGSPIYIGSVTGAMRSLLERMLFQYLVYDKNNTSLFKKKVMVGMVYTMGAPEIAFKNMELDKRFKSTEMFVKHIFGQAESLFICDTYQFDDYSKYESSAFDLEEKTRVRDEIFPIECKKAFEMGVRFADKSNFAIDL